MFSCPLATFLYVFCVHVALQVNKEIPASCVNGASSVKRKYRASPHAPRNVAHSANVFIHDQQKVNTKHLYNIYTMLDQNSQIKLHALKYRLM